MMQAQILELLEELRRDLGLAHDPDHARPVGAGRDLRPRRDHVRRPDRRVGPGRRRSTRHPQHPYTQRLLGGIPDGRRPARAGAGHPRRRRPTRLRIPAGCRFAPRCHQAQRPLSPRARCSCALADTSGARTVRCACSRRWPGRRHERVTPRRCRRRRCSRRATSRCTSRCAARRRVVRALDGVDLAWRRGEVLGHRRRVGLRQVDARPRAAGARSRRPAATIQFDGAAARPTRACGRCAAASR